MVNSSEAKARRGLIAPALKKARWDITNPAQVGLGVLTCEFSTTGGRAPFSNYTAPGF